MRRIFRYVVAVAIIAVADDLVRRQLFFYKDEGVAGMVVLPNGAERFLLGQVLVSNDSSNVYTFETGLINDMALTFALTEDTLEVRSLLTSSRDAGNAAAAEAQLQLWLVGWESVQLTHDTVEIQSQGHLTKLQRTPLPLTQWRLLPDTAQGFTLRKVLYKGLTFTSQYLNAVGVKRPLMPGSYGVVTSDELKFKLSIGEVKLSNVGFEGFNISVAENYDALASPIGRWLGALISISWVPDTDRLIARTDTASIELERVWANETKLWLSCENEAIKIDGEAACAEASVFASVVSQVESFVDWATGTQNPQVFERDGAIATVVSSLNDTTMANALDVFRFGAANFVSLMNQVAPALPIDIFSNIANAAVAVGGNSNTTANSNSNAMPPSGVNLANLLNNAAAIIASFSALPTTTTPPPPLQAAWDSVRSVLGIRRLHEDNDKWKRFDLDGPLIFNALIVESVENTENGVCLMWTIDNEDTGETKLASALIAAEGLIRRSCDIEFSSTSGKVVKVYNYPTPDTTGNDGTNATLNSVVANAESKLYSIICGAEEIGNDNNTALTFMSDRGLSHARLVSSEFSPVLPEFDLPIDDAAYTVLSYSVGGNETRIDQGFTLSLHSEEPGVLSFQYGFSNQISCTIHYDRASNAVTYNSAPVLTTASTAVDSTEITLAGALCFATRVSFMPQEKDAFHYIRLMNDKSGQKIELERTRARFQVDVPDTNLHGEYVFVPAGTDDTSGSIRLIISPSRDTDGTYVFLISISAHDTERCEIFSNTPEAKANATTVFVVGNALRMLGTTGERPMIRGLSDTNATDMLMYQICKTGSSLKLTGESLIAVTPDGQQLVFLPEDQMFVPNDSRDGIAVKLEGLYLLTSGFPNGMKAPLVMTVVAMDQYGTAQLIWREDGSRVTCSIRVNAQGVVEDASDASSDTELARALCGASHVRSSAGNTNEADLTFEGIGKIEFHLVQRLV